MFVVAFALDHFTDDDGCIGNRPLYTVSKGASAILEDVGAVLQALGDDREVEEAAEVRQAVPAGKGRADRTAGDVKAGVIVPRELGAVVQAAAAGDGALAGVAAAIAKRAKKGGAR